MTLITLWASGWYCQFITLGGKSVEIETQVIFGPLRIGYSSHFAKKKGGSGPNLTETLADIVCATGRGLFENTYHITLFFKWPVRPKFKIFKLNFCIFHII